MSFDLNVNFDGRQFIAGFRDADGQVKAISPPFSHPVLALLYPISHGVSSKTYKIYEAIPNAQHDPNA